MSSINGIPISNSQSTAFFETNEANEQISQIEMKTQHVVIQSLNSSCATVNDYGKDTVLTSESIDEFEELPVEKFRQQIADLNLKMQSTNETGDKLDLNKIEEQFFPRFQFRYKNAIYYCSTPFEFGEDHYQTVFALVEIEGKVYPRVFYLSHSQGTWRSPPLIDMGWGMSGWVLRRWGKGYFESDTNLPISITLALHSLMNKYPVNKLEPQSWQEEFSLKAMRNKIFEHSKTFSQSNNRQGEIAGVGLTRSYRELVLPSPFSEVTISKNEWLECQKQSKKREVPTQVIPPPEAIHVLNSMYPDLKTIITMRHLVLDLYGEVTLRSYRSFNQSIDYLFCETQDGHVFLMCAESSDGANQVEKHGVLKNPLDLQHMDAPLYEYKHQITQKHAVEETAQKASAIPKIYQMTYGPFWNYVRELQITNQYYLQRGLSIPSKL